MLMRIREQKGVIRLIFIALIVVFAASFVIGGVGSGSNFSLSDIIGNSSGSSSTSTTSGSVSDLQKQLKAQPKNAALWSQLSSAYTTNSQTDRAIGAAEKAVELAPKNVDDKKSLASLYQDEGERPELAGAVALQRGVHDLQQQSPDSSPFNLGTGTLGAAIESPFVKQQSDAYSVQINSLETKSQTLRDARRSAGTTRRSPSTRRSSTAHVNDAQSWLSYATTAEQVGNNKAALLGYQTFLKLVPADPISPQVRTPREVAQEDARRAGGREQEVDDDADQHDVDHDDVHLARMSLTAARTGDDGALVVIDGPLDYHSTEELAELLGGLLQGGRRRGSRSTWRAATPIDDAAIGVLFRGLRAPATPAESLAIGAPEERLRDALETMGVDRVLRVTENREAALTALGLEAPDGW